MNPWQSISGAVCLHIFMALVQKTEKIDDLVMPLCCSLYLADHWEDLNFSKTDNIEELRPHVNEDIMMMKDILINQSDNIQNKVKSYLDHLNGSLAFSVVIIQSLYNDNLALYQNNLKTLFQECWEIIFWFVQDVDNTEYKNLVCDFSELHTPTFRQVLNTINEMNPV